MSYSLVLPAMSANRTAANPALPPWSVRSRVVSWFAIWAGVGCSGAVAALSGGAQLGLRGRRMHRRIGLVGRGFRLADLDRVAHVGQYRAQGRQAQHDVFRLARITHQADAPDL